MAHLTLFLPCLGTTTRNDERLSVNGNFEFDQTAVNLFLTFTPSPPFPFTGVRHSRCTTWMRWTEGRGVLTEVHIVNYLATLSFPCWQWSLLFLLSLGWGVQERRPLPLVQTHFNPTAIHNLGRYSLNCMNHYMFAYCDLSPLCPSGSFTVIPLLLSEPTQNEISREDSVAKKPPRMLNTVRFDPWQRPLFPYSLVQRTLAGNPFVGSAIVAQTPNSYFRVHICLLFKVRRLCGCN